MEVQLTRQEVTAYEEKLQEIDRKLVEILEAQRVARDMGDLSENEEYASATREAKKLQKEKYEINDLLEKCVIIEPEDFVQIMIGATVGITQLGDNNKPIAEERVFQIASKGNTLKGTLGIDSPLGKAILNGTDGVYTIQTVSGVKHYSVRKVY